MWWSIPLEFRAVAFFRDRKTSPRHPFFPFTHSPASPNRTWTCCTDASRCRPCSSLLSKREVPVHAVKRSVLRSPPTTLRLRVSFERVSILLSFVISLSSSARLPSMIVSLTSRHGCLDPCIARFVFGFHRFVLPDI